VPTAGLQEHPTVAAARMAGLIPIAEVQDFGSYSLPVS
jgi:hypothetical protein